MTGLGPEEKRARRAARRAAAEARRAAPPKPVVARLHPSALRWAGQRLAHRLRRGLSGGLSGGLGWLRALPPVVAVAGPRAAPRPPRRTLILHIGMGKTGTTAIQTALWDNREALARCGITYPTLGAVAKAHHLITPRCPPFLAHTGWRFLEAAEWAPLLAGAGTGPVLMSSELIIWVEPEQVAAFCAALAEHFDVKAAIYLRRQDNAVMASYNQMIKAGTQVAPLDRLIDRQLHGFDYLAKLWPWEEALGAENLIVAPYERGQFHKGDLIDDFLLRVLGLAERPEGFTVAEARNANPRLSRAAMEYKRAINNLIREPGRSERFNPPIARYSERTDAGSGAIFHEHDLLSPEQRAFVLRVCEPGNAYIARKFLGRPDGALFLDTAIPKTRRPAEAPDLGPEFQALSDLLAREEPALLAELQAAVAAALADPEATPGAQKAAADLQASFGTMEALAPPAA